MIFIVGSSEYSSIFISIIRGLFSLVNCLRFRSSFIFSIHGVEISLSFVNAEGVVFHAVLEILRRM